jgi:hypothetical protein
MALPVRLSIAWSCALWLCVLAQPLLHGDTLRWNARTLYERSVTSHVRLLASPEEIELQRGVLYEDDGPAAGYSYQANVEKLVPSLRIRKQLLIDDPAARAANLLVARGGTLKGTVNGQPVSLKTPARCGNYWQAYEIAPSTLRAGRNDLVLWGKGQVWIARDEEFAAGSRTRVKHPNRSARSTDGGKSWDDKHLGTTGEVDGEYYVRLFLDQYQPHGVVTLPVLDLANLAEKPVAPPVDSPGPVRITVAGTPGRKGNLAVQVRSGPCYVPDEKHWSDWQVLAGGVLKEPAGRYLQVAVKLSTRDRQQSPRLQGITIEASPKITHDWTGRVRVVSSDNPRIVRSSIPFAYEPFSHPHLKRLRQEYRLDEVVGDAKSEWELITRLATWSAQRWQKGHLGESYPPWDALAILKPHRDGNPVGGFCLQYNLVFLQACESFGLVGRVVSLGPGNHTDQIRSGHEVVEIWSNTHRKWVYIDGHHALYAVDARSNVPLSLLQLHQRQTAALARQPYSPIRIVYLGSDRGAWPGLTEKIPFLELRLIPRSNFLEQQSPLPLNQGMRGWFWTGHYVWSDQAAPARPLYSKRISKPGNWEWTLNQVHLVLEARPQPGALQVHFDTQTPGLQSFLARVDSGQAEKVSAPFVWKLHAGTNRLQIHPRNVAGRDGSTSDIVLEYRSR